MRIIVLLLIIAIAHSHIYSSPPKITYTYNGRPKYYSLYMSLQSGLGASDYLRLIWPEAIHNTLKTEIIVNLITYNNNIKVATTTCVSQSVVGASVYHVRLGAQMLPNTWYEVQVFPSKNPTTSPINYLLQVMTVSTFNADQIIYDSNMAFGFLNILAPLASQNTLAMSISSSSTIKNTPSAIYDVDIDITPTISSTTGANFTLYIFYDSTLGHSTDTTILDFTFIGICEATAFSVAETAAVLNFCQISADLTTITFSINSITAAKPIRIHTSVNNPAYYSIRGIRGYWAEFISGRVYQNNAINSALLVNKISILTSTQRVQLFWGIESTYTDSTWTTAVPLFKAASTNPNILPYNSFNCGFSFTSPSPINGRYTVRMTIGAQGVLQGSIVHNLPAFSGMTVFCSYVTTQIVCKNVGAFINTGYRYWISGKAFFASTTASTLAFGGVSIVTMVYSSTGVQILTPVLYNDLAGVTLNVATSQQFLDTAGYHNTNLFSIGNAQVVSQYDDITLSSTANAMPLFLQGTNSTVGIVPDLGTSQQLLFLMKTLTGSISGASAATNYQIQLMFNNKVISFQSTEDNRGLDFVGYNSATTSYSIEKSPCYLSTIVCEKYNLDTPLHNKRILVNAGGIINYYGMYTFKCGTSFITTPSPACTSNCAAECTMFSGYGTTTGQSSVMAMRQVIFPTGYHPSLYADNNLLDFLFIFTHGTQIISYCLINGYTVTGAKLTNIKAAYVNYYDNTAGSYNKGVRIPMMLRIGGGILPYESLSATAVGIFIDDNIDASTFYTTPDESWSLGCSTSDCKYYQNKGLSNTRTDNWLSNRMFLVKNLPPLQNEFNILIPVTPDATTRSPPRFLTIVFFTETYTFSDVTGLLTPVSVYRIYGPTVTGSLSGSITTINGLLTETGGASLTPDMELTADTFSSTGSFTVSLNTTNMYSSPTNNTFTFGNSNTGTFGARFGAGYTITSFYYNIFASSTLSWNKPPSNTSSTCSVFGYIYKEIQNPANNLFKTGKWIYTAFCPIDSTHNMQSSDANINFINPQYPLVFTNNFDLRSVITIAYSNEVGYLRGYRKESSPIATLVRSCTTAKLQTYNPSSSGKQRAPFTITLPAIAMSENGFDGYKTFQVEFAIPSTTAASSGLTMLSQCDVTVTNLECTIVGSPSSSSITIQIEYKGTGVTSVSFLQVNLYATAASIFGTAAPYTVTIYLPQYFTAGPFTIPFGSSYSPLSSRTTYCTCSSSFTVGITAYGTSMALNTFTTTTKMTKTRSKLSFNFGASSYRDAFFKTSTFVFNLGYITNPNFATYRSRNNFRCIIYQGLNASSMTQSSSWDKLSLTSFDTVTLTPKGQISTPSGILYSMQCFGGAMPDGTNTSAITGFWKDNGANVQTAASLTYTSALYTSGFPFTATLSISAKRFVTVGSKAMYSFAVSCNTALTANAIYYFDFHMSLSSFLDNEGGIQCYIRTSAVLSDTAAQSTYCSFSNSWQLMVWNNQNAISSGTTIYIDIYNIDQPKVADITASQFISVTIDSDSNYDNGVLASAQVVDNVPVANAVTDIFILSTTVDNSYILSKQTIVINFDTITTSVFASVTTFYVLLPSSYSEWLARGQSVSMSYVAGMTSIYCIFLATGQTTNQATNCIFISKRILKITSNAIAATRLFTLTLGNFQTPSAVPLGKFNEFKFMLYIADGAQSNILSFSYTDYSKSITLAQNQLLISLSWNSYSLTVSDSFFTLTSTNSQIITIRTGYYSNIIELRQSIYPSNFRANLILTLSNSDSTYFSYLGNSLNVDLGAPNAYFKIAANYNALPGLYTLTFTKTGDTNSVYTNIPPLTLVIQSTKCQLNTGSLNYQIPLGGSTLPILINALSCIPIDNIVIGVTFVGTGFSNFSLNADLSSVKLSYTSLDGQLYFVFTHRAGTMVAGNTITVQFTITGTNSASYLTIPSITLTLISATTFANAPTATALTTPVISGNTATFRLQCSQTSLIYWGIGLYPSVINNQAVDFQARIISQGNGLITNFTQSDDYFDRAYGVLQGSTMQVVSKTLYNLQSNTNYLFKFFCINQLGRISDSQSLNFTSVNYGAYLMKIQVKFSGSITYQQYNDLACSMANTFNIPYIRVLTEAMSYCNNLPLVFYATSTATILNQPDPSGKYIYGFYIEPDYNLISDYTNVNIRQQLSISSTSLTIISSTANSVSLPALVQMQTYDISIYTTPIVSISKPISGLTSVIITATITNMNGFIIIGVYDGLFNSSIMTIPSATNIKQGKFSTSVNLFAVQMIHTSQNYNTNFQFTGLRANSVYSFFYFSTVEDPSIAALSSSVSVTSALTLQMLIIDINWEWRSAMVVLLCLFFVVM